MFGHLVADTKVWLIEREVSGTTRYFRGIDKSAVVWTKKIGRATTYPKKEAALQIWESINQRGTLKQHRLAKILEDAAKG